METKDQGYGNKYRFIFHVNLSDQKVKMSRKRMSKQKGMYAGVIWFAFSCSPTSVHNNTTFVALANLQ